MKHVKFKMKFQRGQNRFCLEVRGLGGERGDEAQGGEMAQTMYTHMNK
jgi:hypothetical protein